MSETALFCGIGRRHGLKQCGRVGRRRLRLGGTCRHCKAGITNDTSMRKGLDHGFTNAYLTIIGTSFFAAQTRATTHPIIVHPKKKFRRRMEVMSRLLRAKAMIVGRKYSKTQAEDGEEKYRQEVHVHTSLLLLRLAPSGPVGEGAKITPRRHGVTEKAKSKVFSSASNCDPPNAVFAASPL